MLSSWKEIAHFFGKGVRTVQRWEKTLNLPIRRPPGAPSNVVLARTSDLEAWMHRGLGKTAVEGSNAAVESAELESEVIVSELEDEVRALILHAGGKVISSADNSISEASTTDRLRKLLEEVRASSGSSERDEHPLRKVA